MQEEAMGAYYAEVEQEMARLAERLAALKEEE